MIIVKHFMILPFEFGQFQIHHKISLRILNVRTTYCFRSCISKKNENDKTIEKLFFFFFIKRILLIL